MTSVLRTERNLLTISTTMCKTGFLYIEVDLSHAIGRSQVEPAQLLLLQLQLFNHNSGPENATLTAASDQTYLGKPTSFAGRGFLLCSVFLCFFFV